MKNTKTRLLSLVLAVIMVVSMLPATVLAEEGLGDETSILPQTLSEEPSSVVSVASFTDAEGTETTFGYQLNEDGTTYSTTKNGEVDTTYDAHADNSKSEADAAMFALVLAFKAAKENKTTGTVTLYKDVDLHWSSTSNDPFGFTGENPVLISNEKESSSSYTPMDLTINLNGHTLDASKGKTNQRLAYPRGGNLTINGGMAGELGEDSNGNQISGGGKGKIIWPMSPFYMYTGTDIVVNGADLEQTSTSQAFFEFRGTASTYTFNGGSMKAAAIVSHGQTGKTYTGHELTLQNGFTFITNGGADSRTHRNSDGTVAIIGYTDTKVTVGEATFILDPTSGVEIADHAQDKYIALGGTSSAIGANVTITKDGVLHKVEEVTIEGTSYVKHTFVPTYNVTTSADENGTVTAAPTEAAEGDTVTLTVTPNSTGYELDTLLVNGEDKAAEVTDNTYTFTMPDGNVEVVATFKEVVAANGNLVNVERPENGTVEADLSEATEGTTVTLTVKPDTGYEVKTITMNGDALEAVDGVYSFTMPDAEATVTVTFQVKLGEPAVSYSDGTTTTNYYVAVADDVDRNAYDTMQKAVEAAFEQWDVNGKGQIDLYQDYTVTGKLPGYDDAKAADSIYSNSACVNVHDGDSLVLDAHNHTVTNETSGRLFMLSGENVETYLEVKNATLVSKQDNSTNGTILFVGSSSKIEEKGTVKFIDCHATSTSGSWGIAVTGSADLHVYLIGGTYDVEHINDGTSEDAPKNIYLQGGVKFYSTNANGYVVRNDAGDGGTLHLDNAVLYTKTEDITGAGINVVYSEGMALKTVEVNEVDFEVVTAPTGTIYKHTVETLYDVNVTKPENGSVEKDMDQAFEGDTVTLTIAPDEGYQVGNVSVKNGEEEVTVTAGDNNEYTFTMPAADVTVTVDFQKNADNIRNITVDNEIQNGEVVAASNAEIGSTVTLTVTPDTGYEVDKVTVKEADETEVTVVKGGNANEYTFEMPAEAVTVTATFKLVKTKAVSFDDGTGEDMYYTAVAAEGDDTFASVEDAFQKAYSAFENEAAGTVCTIKLYQDCTIDRRLVASGSNSMSIDAGQKLVIDLNGFKMDYDITVYRSGTNNFRMFTFTGEDKTSSLEIKNGDLEYAGTDYILTVGSGGDNAIQGTLKFTNVDIAYLGTQTTRGGFNVNASKDFEIILDGCTYNSPTAAAFYGGNASEYKVTLTGGTKVYSGFKTPVVPSLGTLYLEDAVVYTLEKTVVTNSDAITCPEGMALKTVEVNEVDIEGVTVPEGTIIYKHTVEKNDVPTTYTVTVNPADHGTVTATPEGVVEAGTVVTVTVAADEGYRLSALTVNGEAVTVTNGTYTFTVEADATIAAEFVATPVASFVNIGASCEAEVVLQLKYKMPAEITSDSGAYVVITKYDINTKQYARQDPILISDLTVDSSSRHIVEIGFPSSAMAKDVTVEMYDGNGDLLLQQDNTSGGTGLVTESIVRSIRDYVELGLTKGNASQKALYTALAVYGGYAQKYFNVDADAPIYDVIAECGLTLPDISNITAADITQELSKTEDSIGIYYATQSALLDSKVSLRTFYKLDEGNSIDNFTFAVDYIDGVSGAEVHKDLTVYQETSGQKRYYVDIEAIEAVNWDKMYTVTVTNKTTGATYVVTGSVMAYVGRMLAGSTNPDQLNLGRSMYYYNQAANTYFTNFKY